MDRLFAIIRRVRRTLHVNEFFYLVNCCFLDSLSCVAAEGTIPLLMVVGAKSISSSAAETCSKRSCFKDGHLYLLDDAQGEWK